MNLEFSKSGQAMPAGTVKIEAEAFAPSEETAIYWLGGAGTMIHSRTTNLMIDPVLEGFDMPLLIDSAIAPEAVPALDAILVTHIDNDHFSRVTTQKLKPVCTSYHAPHYVAEEMRKDGLPAAGHDIHEKFTVGDVEAELTPADHDWQNLMEEFSFRHWAKEDYCGYWLDTPDGTIWMPGDSRLLEEQLHMPQPDVMLFDFADNVFHITFEGAVQLANTYPETELICIHWGTVDAPDMTPFNGNPENLLTRVVNPERVHALMPGEKFTLKGNKK